MFNQTGSGYSLSDLAAVTRNNEDGYMMGGGYQMWWIIILFLFIFNGNGFGWGNRGEGAALQGALTRADLCQDMNFSQMENGIRGIERGLCDGFYAQNTNLLNGFGNIQNALTNGFAGVDRAVCQLGYQDAQNTNTIQQAINGVAVGAMQNANMLQSQISGCCCDIRSGIKDVQFQNAQDTCAVTNAVQNTTRDVIENANNNTRAILDFLVKDKISTLENENQALRLTASQSKQNQYLIEQLRPCPVPAYLVCGGANSPFNAYGYPYASYTGECSRGFGVA